jgi:hypothetical protein
LRDHIKKLPAIRAGFGWQDVSVCRGILIQLGKKFFLKSARGAGHFRNDAIEQVVGLLQVVAAPGDQTFRSSPQ